MRRNRKVSIMPLALGISVLAALICAAEAIKRDKI